VITRSTLCRLKTTVRRTSTPSSRSLASSHRILSSLTHSGGFASSLDKIYGRVGIVCVESTSKNGFSDGWYALNPGHGQEGGRNRRQCLHIQGSRCFVFSGGRRASGRIYRRLAVGCTTARRAGNGRFVSLTTQTVPDPGWLSSRASRNRGDIGPAQRAMALKHCVENPQLAQSIYELRILGG
jgi:hypothetical protein